MSIFDDIKSRLNIMDVYTFYTGSHIERHNKALCVFHKDTRPSMSFKGEIFKCFACDKGGDVFKFVEYYLNLKGFEAARRLNDDFRLGLIEDKRYDRRRRLLENKRRAELERQREIIRLEQLKNDTRLEKIYNLQNYITLLKKVLDVEGLSEGEYRWAEGEIEATGYELDEVFSDWESENKGFLKNLLDTKRQVADGLEEERLYWESVKRKREELLSRRY